MSIQGGGGGGAEGAEGAELEASEGDSLLGAAPAAKPRAAAARSLPLYLLTFMSALGGFLFGYDTGVISGAVLLIVSDMHLQGESFEQELIVSATLVGCIVSAAAARSLAELLGRKPVIVLSSAVFAVGAAVMALAADYRELVAGRFVIGLGVGLASMAVPLYIAEAAPPASRGQLVTLNNVFITGGQFISCVIAGLFSKQAGGWRWMLGVGAAPALVQLAGFLLFLPESPRWLARHKGRAEALRVVAWLRAADGSAAIESEVDEIMRSIAAEDKQLRSQGALPGLWSALMRDPPLRRALALGCMLQAVQQLTGINTVMYYCGTIIVMAGFTDTSEAIWLTAAVSFVGFVFTCVGLFAVERLGRRRLTLGSLAGVALALAALGGGFYYSKATSAAAVPTAGCEYSTCYECVLDAACGFCSAGGACVAGNATAASNASACAAAGADPAGSAYHGRSCPKAAGALNVGGIWTLCATSFYLAAFQPGMGPMPWTINAEIYPLHARAMGVSTATTVNWVGNLVISLTFLDLTKAVSTYGAFWIYCGVAVLGWAWLYVYLPETRGLTLEEISKLFEKAL